MNHGVIVLVLLLTLWGSNFGLLAQGSVNFQNVGDGFVSRVSSCTTGPLGRFAKAELWGGQKPDELAQIGDSVQFLALGLFSGGLRTFEALNVGDEVYLQVRAWTGDFESYAEALVAGEEVGESNIFLATLGGDGMVSPRPPGTLVGLKPFEIGCSEGGNSNEAALPHNGAISFTNVGDGVDAPICGPEGLLDGGFAVQLQFENGRPIGAPAPILGSGLFSGGTRIVPGVPSGDSVRLRVAVTGRISNGVLIKGTSDAVSVTLGDKASPATLIDHGLFEIEWPRIYSWGFECEPVLCGKIKCVMIPDLGEWGDVVDDSYCEDLPFADELLEPWFNDTSDGRLEIRWFRHPNLVLFGPSDHNEGVDEVIRADGIVEGNGMFFVHVDPSKGNQYYLREVPLSGHSERRPNPCDEGSNQGISYTWQANGDLELRWPKRANLVRSSAIGGQVEVIHVEASNGNASQNIQTFSTSDAQHFFWLE